MKKIKRHLVQIGVIGSMMDIKQNSKAITLASNLGKEIARKNAVLLFGFEGDHSSLSEIAAKSAKNNGGLIVGFIYGNKKIQSDKPDLIQIVTGQCRGGGREFSFILSCDVLIVISGESGTLMEMSMAYQVGIPIVVIKNSGGWADKLKGKFLDKRKRLIIRSANSAEAAVKKAILLFKNNL